MSIPFLGKVPAPGLTVQRYGAYAIVSGRPVRPAPVDVLIPFPRIAIQPASADTVQRLPEGVGVQHAVEIVSYDLIRAASEDGDTAADRFVHDGKTYDVQTSLRMPPFLGIQPEHWEATAIDIAKLPMPEGS